MFTFFGNTVGNRKSSVSNCLPPPHYSLLESCCRISSDQWLGTFFLISDGNLSITGLKQFTLVLTLALSLNRLFISLAFTPSVHLETAIVSPFSTFSERLYKRLKQISPCKVTKTWTGIRVDRTTISEHGHIVFCIGRFQILLNRYLYNTSNTPVQPTCVSSGVPEPLRWEGVSSSLSAAFQSGFEHCHGWRFSGQPIPVRNYLHSRNFYLQLPRISSFSLGPVSLILLLCISGICLASSSW